MNMLEGFLIWVTRAIDLIGCSVLIYGVIVCLWMFIKKGMVVKDYANHSNDFLSIRETLGRYLLLGLELMIAADVIHTVIEPSFEEIILIFVIVIIRTVLTYSLGKEMEKIHDFKKK